jgi:heme A synthase
MDTWHREAALVVLLLVAVVGALAWRQRQRAMTRAVGAVMALAGAQVVLGLSMAYGSLSPPAQIAHLTSSSLLLGAETVLFLLVSWLPD